jgi:endonuclease YncB( thermonuclease family)
LSGSNWTYRTWNSARVERIIDGDTIEMSWELDLGFGDTYTRLRPFRLLGVDAPDKSLPEKRLAALNFVKALLPVGTYVTLTSVRTDKYQPRYNAVINLWDGRNLADVLIESGHGRAWTGHGPKPWSLHPALASHPLRVVED